MRLFELRRDGRRWTQDRHVRNCYGEREFDSKYLMRRVTLALLGVPIWHWYEDVRQVPVHEWAMCALGDPCQYPDEPMTPDSIWKKGDVR